MSLYDAYLVSCALCGEDVDPSGRSTRHHITSGWVVKRTKGGVHNVELIEYDGRFAHADCVDKVKRGVLGQESLL